MIVLLHVAFVIHELNFYLLAMRGQDRCIFTHTTVELSEREKKIVKLPFTFQITFFLEKQLLLSPFNFSKVTHFYSIISLNVCVFLQSLQTSMTLMTM